MVDGFAIPQIETTAMNGAANPTLLTDALPQPTNTPQVTEEVVTALPEIQTPDIEPPAVETPQVEPTVLQTPVEQVLPEQPATEVPPLDVPVPPTSDAAAAARRAAQNEMSFLVHDQAMSSASPKQRRPLHRRQLVEDHFDITTDDTIPGQDSLVTVSAVGGIANGRSVGRSQPVQFKANTQKVKGTINDLTKYATRFPGMSPVEQSAGAINLIYDNVTRYLPEATIPGQETIGEIVNAFNLYAQWDRISDASRFRRTANQVIRTARDLNFGDQIPQSAVNSLNLINFGFSTYQLLENWDKMNPAQRGVAALNAINSGVQAYSAGSALINGASSATATGATAGANGLTITGALSYAGGILGAYTLIDGWGTGGADGRVNGAASGAAIGGSLFGPVGAGIGAAIGVAVGSIKTGKSAEQQKRDAFRSHYEKNKVFEKQYGTHVIQLADGNFYNVGVDGSGGRAEWAGSTKTFANPERINNPEGVLEGGELRPYNIDYTNDLDFVTGWATKALNIILNGGSHVEGKTAAESQQMNGYLVNAATANAGRDLNQTNFAAVMANVRHFYSKMGITNKAQAMQILNELRQMGRITTEDMDSLLYGLEFAFSENYDTAASIMSQLRAQDEARQA